MSYQRQPVRRWFAVLLALIAWLRIGAAHAAVDRWSNEGPQGADVSAMAVDPADASVVYVGTNRGGVFKSKDGGLSWTAAREGLRGAMVLEIDIDPNDTQTIYAVTIETPSDQYPGGLFRSTNGGESWAAVTGLPDSFVSSVVIDHHNPGTVYAAVADTQTGGVFKSTDRGNLWTPILERPVGRERDVAEIVLDPSDSQTIYAATRASLLKTTSGGETWDTIGNGLPFFDNDRVVDFAFDPLDSRTLYAGGFGGLLPSGVYKSTDAGANWEPTGGEVSAAVKRLVGDPTRSGTLYALHTEGVFKTTDAGTQWILMNAQLPPRRFRFNALDLALADPDRLYVGMGPAAPVPVYRSNDGAGTWEPAAVRGLTNTFLLSLAVDPTDPQIRYAPADIASNQNEIPLMKGGSDPESWVRLDGLLNARLVVIDPVDTNVVYVGSDNDGVFKSTDAGAMWRRANIGMAGTRVPCLAIDPMNRQRLYACAFPALFRSVNGGTSWQPIGDQLRDDGASGPALPRMIAIDPVTPSTLYVATSDQGVFKSVDGGDTWQRSDEGMASPEIQSVAIDPVDPRIVYAGGYTFTGVLQGPGGVYKSLDGGVSWRAANGGEEQPIGVADVRALTVDSTCPQIVYAATDRGVFRSSDGAASWTLLDAGLFFPDVRTLLIDPLDPAVLHVATFGAGVFSITQSARAEGTCPATPTPEATVTMTPMSTTPSPTPTVPGLPCEGDCDGSGSVRIEELVRAVRIALGAGSIGECALLDLDLSGRIEIFELVRAVRRALLGC